MAGDEEDLDEESVEFERGGTSGIAGFAVGIVIGALLGEGSPCSTLLTGERKPGGSSSAVSNDSGTRRKTDWTGRAHAARVRRELSGGGASSRKDWTAPPTKCGTPSTSSDELLAIGEPFREVARSLAIDRIHEFPVGKIR